MPLHNRRGSQYGVILCDSATLKTRRPLFRTEFRARQRAPRFGKTSCPHAAASSATRDSGLGVRVSALCISGIIATLLGMNRAEEGLVIRTTSLPSLFVHPLPRKA